MSATLLRSAATHPAARRTSRSVIAGRILSGIAVAFLLFDAGFKFVVATEAVEATAQLGWPAHLMPVLGTIEFALLALYLTPRTAPLGAVLWTGYLGGAIATHLRIENPLFSHTLFPVYVAILVWGGLYLRDARVRDAIAPSR